MSQKKKKKKKENGSRRPSTAPLFQDYEKSNHQILKNKNLNFCISTFKFLLYILRSQASVMLKIFIFPELQ